MPSFNYSERPVNVDPGTVGRAMKRAVVGAVAGGVTGAIAGAPVLGVGALVAGWGGVMIGGIAGLVSGMKSSDPEKMRNRPLNISDPLTGDQQTVYISADQWKEIKNNLGHGFTYDALPSPLDKQFDAATPPAPAKA